MNNFMVQHSNWPNNGCDWLQTRLTNAQTQQAQYNSSSNAYCKIQGKINFLNNFINTGTSTYLNGTATFTLGC
jgi:folate-binding Fe-S cluster repair protein YgfZ